MRVKTFKCKHETLHGAALKVAPMRNEQTTTLASVLVQRLDAHDMPESVCRVDLNADEIRDLVAHLTRCL